ncbi:MAG TPA: hypothetical protein VK308_07235, partial [Pyrinomonadaceae bacterium]|nr:hypothetical protein [Pyrinomonadaceae bacterium]
MIEKKPNYAPGYMMRAKIHSFEENHTAAITDTDSALKIYEPRIENPEDREYTAHILGWRVIIAWKKATKQKERSPSSIARSSLIRIITCFFTLAPKLIAS